MKYGNNANLHYTPPLNDANLRESTIVEILGNELGTAVAFYKYYSNISFKSINLDLINVSKASTKSEIKSRSKINCGFHGKVQPVPGRPDLLEPGSVLFGLKARPAKVCNYKNARLPGQQKEVIHPALHDEKCLSTDQQTGPEEKDRFDVFQAFAERLEKLSDKKKKAVKIHGQINDEHNVSLKLKNKLSDCGSYLVFKDFYEKGEIKLSGGIFCNEKYLCPMCAYLLSMKSCARYLSKYMQIHKENPYKTERTAMLTLTVKDGESLSERLKTLTSTFSTLTSRARRARSGGRHQTEFSKIAGGVGSVEIKKGKRSRLWHPHIHAIVLLDSYLDTEKLSDEWKRYTEDSYIVDARLIYDRNSGRGDELDVMKSFFEVFTYATKFHDLSIPDLLEVNSICKGKRLLRPWGLLWGVKPPKSLTDDIDIDEKKYFEMIFKYVAEKGEYTMKSRKHNTIKEMAKEENTIKKSLRYYAKHSRFFDSIDLEHDTWQK